jgi:hypothetical protein
MGIGTVGQVTGRNATADSAWFGVGASMAAHLDWLEQTAGRRATRDLVDGTLGRLRRQLALLEGPGAGFTLVALATALRDCGVRVGNPNLAALAAAIIGCAGHRPRRRAELVRSLLEEVRRTASWLRIWRALSTPARAWTASGPVDSRVVLQ